MDYSKEKLYASLQSLKETSSLKEIQNYIDDMIITRGFEEETPKDLMLLLTEEVGELAKAVRKTEGLKMDVSKDPDKYDLKGEITDVFNYLLCLCSTMKIDLLQAFKEKEERNSQRIWK